MLNKNIFLALIVLFSLNFVFAESNLGFGYSQVSFSGGVGCFSNVTNSYWISSTNLTVFNSSGSVGNCSLFFNPAVVGSRACCPTGYSCNLATGRCASSNQAGCAQYNTSSECSADVNFVAPSSVEYVLSKPGACLNQTSYVNSSGASCVNYSVCSCNWNASANVKCGPSFGSASQCQGSLPVNMTCNWAESSTQNLCDSQGKIIVVYSASGSALGTTMTSGVKCEDLNVVYPCSASLKLPFFDWFNLIITCLVITIVYFVSSKKSN
jgi:hypothetical protein